MISKVILKPKLHLSTTLLLAKTIRVRTNVMLEPNKELARIAPLFSKSLDLRDIGN